MLRRPTISIALALALSLAGAAAARAALLEVLDLPAGAQPYSVAPQTFGRL